MTGVQQDTPRGRMTGAWIAAIGAIVALAVGLRLAQLSIFDISHSDELMQYLEQANRIATGHGIVPWEWRFGLRNALVPQMLSVPLVIGHALAPGTLPGVWAARLLFATLTLLALPAAWRLGALTGRVHALLALFVVGVWWESVLYSDLLLSESLGAALMLMGGALLLDARTRTRGLALAGLLVGLAVLVRLQYGVFGVVLTCGALRLNMARWRPFLAGALAAGGIGALSDLAAGLTPFSWIWVNLQMNIGEGRAGRFGTAGPLAYLAMLRDHLWPFMPLVLIGAVAAGTRYRPLLYAALVNVAVHSLIAHKEYRFIWISTLTFLLLAGIGSAHLAQRLARGRGAGAGIVAAIAMMLAWAGMSAWSAQLTGGASAYRGGSAVPRLANRAAADPKVCAIAVDYEYKGHIVPTLLARPLPLLLIPRAISRESAPMPPALAASVNALVLQRLPAGAQGYRQVACGTLGDERPCLFVRAGICRPDAQWGYQQQLEANEL
ncbi:hypothetical protein [Novosphingobium sp. Leaf2]|uniref:hypothetical protein n=1 Tax=Novosphingobium sp. Leaf2 TaxID=1735670 RepID=UPI0006FF310E|nr:hypothetical protein [Novosphingobium sp. Leaf2]KQM22143.1 hypothetical protein ASE49_02240 [Novosphingobium sp. Leaf2]